VEIPIEHQQPVRDLMLAIDLSQSMETTDFTDANGQKINRLAAVKDVVHGFIDKRKDDRLGLIVFGSGAYPQAPLTLDHASLSLLLDDTGIGMAGPNTAIGDAIGLSLKLLDQAHEQEKVLILLTDGNDTSSAITPDHAVAMAAAKGVMIHTIGIGDPAAQGEARVNARHAHPAPSENPQPPAQKGPVRVATWRGHRLARAVSPGRLASAAPDTRASAAGGLRWTSTSATSISCARSGYY
jgi:secreted protein with Ig-like and vWFA domain